jgi:hypothetical protein
MRDLSKNDPARMVRYVRHFGHLWLAQRHPKPSLADVVGLVTISIELWHVGINVSNSWYLRNNTFDLALTVLTQLQQHKL